VAARSKAWVYGRSPPETMGSNPTGGMDVWVLWVLCFVRWRSLRRIYHSPRGLLLTVARRCVWSRNLENEEAKARYGAVENTTKRVVTARKETNKHDNLFLCVGNRNHGYVSWGSSNRAGSVRSILLLLMVDERTYCYWAPKYSKLWSDQGKFGFLIVKDLTILG